VLPPLTGVAVKVTGTPWQNGLAEVAIETAGVSSLLAIITIWLETAVLLPL
jgi:hypothetical protein